MGLVEVADAEIVRLRREVDRLRAENGRLSRLLDLRGQDTVPAPEQLSAPLAAPGLVTMASPVEDKLALYTDRFRSRTDVYAVRWDNARTGVSGWMPAVAGGWRKGMDRKAAAYLPLTAQVVAAHLIGDLFVGLYPLRRDNSCHFLVADFDGPAAMLDALAYIKAARSGGIPAAVEISQSGRGAHVWIFFAGSVAASVARGVGTALVHEAMVLRGSMDLRSYDRLFPNQDVLPEGGFGNLIAAPLQGRRRRDGLTAFCDLDGPHQRQHRRPEPRSTNGCVLTPPNRLAREVDHRHGPVSGPVVNDLPGPSTLVVVCGRLVIDVSPVTGRVGQVGPTSRLEHRHQSR